MQSSLCLAAESLWSTLMYYNTGLSMHELDSSVHSLLESRSRAEAAIPLQ